MQPPAGVTVPPHLCRVVARAAVLGLQVLARRDGAAQSAPGLARLLAELDASASGHQFANLDEHWIPVTEAAALAGVSERSVRRLAANGRLRARRAGRDWQVSADSAADYRKDRTTWR